MNKERNCESKFYTNMSLFHIFIGPRIKRKGFKRAKNGRFQLKKEPQSKLSEQEKQVVVDKIRSPNKRMSFSFEDSRECSVERTTPRKQESVNNIVNSVSLSLAPRSSPRLRRVCQNMPNSEVACSDITNTEPPPSIKTDHVSSVRHSPRIRPIKMEKDDSCPNLSPQGQHCDIHLSENSLSQPPHLSELHITTVPSSPRLRRTSVSCSDTCQSTLCCSDVSGNFNIKTENVECNTQDSDILGPKCEVDGRNLFESFFAGFKSSSSSIQTSPRSRNLSGLNGVRQSPRLQERSTVSCSNSEVESVKSAAVKCLDKHFLKDCQKDECEIDVVGIDQETDFKFCAPVSGFDKLMWGSILKPGSNVCSSQENSKLCPEPNNNCHMYRSLSDQCLSKKQQKEHHKNRKRKLSYSVTSSFEDSDETSPVKKVPKLIIRKNKGQDEDILLMQLESKVKRHSSELFNNVKPYPKKLKLKLGNDLTEINLPQ